MAENEKEESHVPVPATSDLCPSCNFEDIEWTENRTFGLESCLFYGSSFSDQKKNTFFLTNCIFPRCDICSEKVRKMMEALNFKPVCTCNPTFVVRIGDILEVCLDNVDDETEPLSESFSTTVVFFVRQRHYALNFFLPSLRENHVLFTHSIKQYREPDGFINKEEHRDAIVVDLNEKQSQPLVNVCHNMAYQDGEIHTNSEGCCTHLNASLTK